MKTTNFSWGDKTIDSRDIIVRYEELQYDYDKLVEALEEAESDFRFVSNTDESSLVEYQDAENALAEAQNDLDKYDKSELDFLTEVVSCGEDSPDWSYGETLINENYFTDYIEELVNDCYEMPKEFDEGKWPWNHMTMDWISAADEAKADYFEIEISGETYLIRA